MRWLALAAAVGASAAVNAARLSLAGPRPAPPRIEVSAETAVETASLFGLGMRRLAADLGMIRLLVYYGSAEKGGDEGHGRPGHVHDYGAGDYREIGPRARRVLDLDPSFSYAALYAAGALAFNLQRPDEALGILEHGLRRDPSNAQYQAYVGAVGFHKKGDAAAVLRLLEPMLASPDCPTMIKSMVAFLYRRTGQRAKAAAVYADILAHSRDPGYRALAERALAELGR